MPGFAPLTSRGSQQYRSQSLRVSGMLYSTSLNPMFFKNIANVGSFHFHFHFRIWRIWKIWKSGKSEIKENWKVIWQKPRESRSLGSLGSPGVSNRQLEYSPNSFMSEVLVESFIKESCKCAWDLHQLFFPTIRFVWENANVKKMHWEVPTGNNEFHLCMKINRSSHQKTLKNTVFVHRMAPVALVGKATRWHHLHQ